MIDKHFKRLYNLEQMGYYIEQEFNKKIITEQNNL
jgi:hypothetical protein